MVKYHIATGDGKAYYGVNYESYREAEAVLRFSQKHDPQAHIVEEEYHFTNADRIRAMSDEELCEFLSQYSFFEICDEGCNACAYKGDCDKRLLEWLKQPAEEK